MHNVSTDASIVFVISNKMIKHEASLIFFCQVSIKRLICMTINKATYTSATKTVFAFLAKNQCIQHDMCRGQRKKSSLEYKLQFLIWLSMTKYRPKSFNKIEFSYADREGDIGCL